VPDEKKVANGIKGQTVHHPGARTKVGLMNGLGDLRFESGIQIKLRLALGRIQC
jgi:hypothetical protein